MYSIRLTTRPTSIAVLTIDQPGGTANVLSTQLWTEFEAALDPLAALTDLKGLVLASAKPGVFVAGADLTLLANASGSHDPTVRTLIQQGLRTLVKLESLPFPTCAAIDGAALGGGLEVALACDYRICSTSEKVQLGLPEVNLGLIPGWGGTQRLPRVMPIQNAREILISGEPVNGRTACVLGLVSPPPCSDPVAAARLLLTDAQENWIQSRESRRYPYSNNTNDDHLLALLGPEEPLAKREAIRVMCLGLVAPYGTGFTLETEAFMRLAGSDKSKRLIAEFLANRRK